MKVWIINPFDNLPVEGYRPQRYWLMAEEFSAAGHDVVLWTQNWSHAKKSRREELSSPGSFELKYVPVPGYRKNISFRRIWSHWRFARNWRKMADRIEEKPQLIIVSSPPLYIGKEVRLYCKENGIRYILDIMDAWPETFERVVPKKVLAPLKRIAQKNYLGADGITAVTKSYLKMAEAYGAKCPSHLCYHGIKSDFDGEEMKAARQKDGVLKFVYIGNMSLSYDLETVIEAVKKDESLFLDIAGAGPNEANLRSAAEGYRRIRFHGYLGEDGVKKLLHGADAGLVPMFNDSCVGVPYKLADYVEAGLPVLNSLEGEAKELLDESSAGCGYKAGDVDSFSKAVAKLRYSIDEIRSNVKKLFEKFNAKKIYPAYVSFAEGIVLKSEKACEREEPPRREWGIWLALAFCLLYAATAQRGVSWGESGMFQYRILTHDLEGFAGLALAHPLYVMTSSVISQFVPEQFLFWFLNFFSGLWMSLALGVLYKLVYEFTGSVKASCLAAMTLGLSHIAWFSSTMSEVYTMSLFFISLETLSFVKFLKTRERGYLIPLAFFNGLGLSVHNFSILAWPVYGFAILAGLAKDKNVGEKLKTVGYVSVSLVMWIIGFMPLLSLAVKSYLVSHDALAVLKSLLFGEYAGVVSGMNSINVKTAIFNFGITLLSLSLPGCFYLFKKPCVPLDKSVKNFLRAILAVHFVFWVRYFVPDQAMFFLPTMFFVVLLASSALAGVKRVKAFVAGSFILSVFIPCAAYFIGKNAIRISPEKSLPYRNEIAYFAFPWKSNEKSAEKFVFKVASEVNGPSTVYADITPMAALGCAKKMNWLPRSLQLHDSYFNGSKAIERTGEKYFEVRPFPPYRTSPSRKTIHPPSKENILFSVD